MMPLQVPASSSPSDAQKCLAELMASRPSRTSLLRAG